MSGLDLMSQERIALSFTNAMHCSCGSCAQFYNLNTCTIQKYKDDRLLFSLFYSPVFAKGGCHVYRGSDGRGSARGM